MSKPNSLNSAVMSPSRPSVARKAKANGMPAKLLATPENVISVERRLEGKRPRMTARAIRRPNTTPNAADATEMRIEIQNMENGERSGAAPVWTEAAPPELAVSVLLDIGSDDGVPVLGDHVLGRRLLIEGREHGLGVERRVGELGQEVSRDGVPACEVVEA